MARGGVLFGVWSSCIPSLLCGPAPLILLVVAAWRSTAWVWSFLDGGSVAGKASWIVAKLANAVCCVLSSIWKLSARLWEIAWGMNRGVRSIGFESDHTAFPVFLCIFSEHHIFAQYLVSVSFTCSSIEYLNTRYNFPSFVRSVSKSLRFTSSSPDSGFQVILSICSGWGSSILFAFQRPAINWVYAYFLNLARSSNCRLWSMLPNSRLLVGSWRCKSSLRRPYHCHQVRVNAFSRLEHSRLMISLVQLQICHPAKFSFAVCVNRSSPTYLSHEICYGPELFPAVQIRFLSEQVFVDP